MISTMPDSALASPPVADTAARAVVAKAVMRMFKEWGLSTGDQAALLGLARNSRTTLARYAGGHPLGASRDLLDRAGHLLAIYKNLALLYPENPAVRARWMSAKNAYFNGATPVEVVRGFGFTGLLLVRARLDGMRGH